MRLAVTLDASLAYAARRGRDDFAQLAVRRVLLDAAQSHDMAIAALLGRCRLKHIARVRHCAIWLARKVSGASYPMLGRICGRRHHTSVLHSVKTVDSLVSVREASTLRTLRKIIAHAERKARA